MSRVIDPTRNYFEAGIDPESETMAVSRERLEAVELASATMTMTATGRFIDAEVIPPARTGSVETPEQLVGSQLIEPAVSTDDAFQARQAIQDAYSTTRELN